MTYHSLLLGDIMKNHMMLRKTALSELLCKAEQNGYSNIKTMVIAKEDGDWMVYKKRDWETEKTRLLLYQNSWPEKKTEPAGFPAKVFIMAVPENLTSCQAYHKTIQFVHEYARLIERIPPYREESPELKKLLKKHKVCLGDEVMEKIKE
jgi:hypothetical protein